MLPYSDPGTHWIPHTDVFFNPRGDVVIKVELASMRHENLELSLEGGHLRVAGQRPDVDREGSRYLITEIPYGHFEMILDVPLGFDLRSATAEYENGLLRVVIPPGSDGGSPPDRQLDCIWRG